MLRLKEKYDKEIAPALKEQFKYKSVMQIPKLEKVVINMGLGEVKENPKAVSYTHLDVYKRQRLLRTSWRISGREPILQKAAAK